MVLGRRDMRGNTKERKGARKEVGDGAVGMVARKGRAATSHEGGLSVHVRAAADMDVRTDDRWIGPFFLIIFRDSAVSR